jgi:acetylglutamate kinase
VVTNRHRSKRIVIKIGGRALETPLAAHELAAELAVLSGEAVLVHGGGSEVSTWCKKLGIEPRFENGLRITDPPTLEVAAAVLAGLANKRLVAALRAEGVDAVGLAALDGGIVEARPHPAAERLGEVGTVADVHPALLETLMKQGRLPVLASLGEFQGRLLNLNADDLAAALASALHAGALVLLSDVAGVQLRGHLVKHVGHCDELDRLIADPEVTGGMIAKLVASRSALDDGVARVYIAAWQGAGTLRDIIGGAGLGTTLESGVADRDTAPVRNATASTGVGERT